MAVAPEIKLIGMIEINALSSGLHEQPEDVVNRTMEKCVEDIKSKVDLSEAQKGRVWKYIQSGNGENARGFHHAAVVEPFDFVFVCTCYIFLMFILIIFNMFPKRNI